MKIYFIAFLVNKNLLKLFADKEDAKSSEDFKYSHLKLDLIQTDDLAIGLSAGYAATRRTLYSATKKG